MLFRVRTAQKQALVSAGKRRVGFQPKLKKEVVPLMLDDDVKPSTIERRVALDERKRVDEMSSEEMRQALLTSEVTGLPNRRAFDEAGRAVTVAMSDVDGLNALNRYGYDAGK